tara:strand:+ start:1371 stop:2318 length:948 start_codon:yes stop_codon:yes gene_type:complete
MNTISNKFNRALVTGGAGFIGSHIVEELLLQGIKVVSVDDYSSGKAYNLSAFKSNPNLSIEECDVTDFDKLNSIFHKYKFDIVFHNAASKKNICLKNPPRDLEVNGTGAYNICELSLRHKVKKLMHASTGSVYGEAKILPQNELHPLNPTSYYGVSKLAGERYVKMYSDQLGLNATILRYFHVFGSRQEHDPELGGVVSIFIDRAKQGLPLIIHGDGTQQRSFTHVKDIVGINFHAATHENSNGEAYNCASGVNVTIQELADFVKEKTSLNEEHIYDDWLVGDIKVFDIENAKIKALGFNFSTSFQDGLNVLLEK